MDRQTRMYDNFDRVEQRTIEEILNIVYDALEERGYNAIDQMVGYILSGDPSYITSHNNARNIMGRIERDDLVEELIRAYLQKKLTMNGILLNVKIIRRTYLVRLFFW